MKPCYFRHETVTLQETCVSAENPTGQFDRRQLDHRWQSGQTNLCQRKASLGDLWFIGLHSRKIKNIEWHRSKLAARVFIYIYIQAQLAWWILFYSVSRYIQTTSPLWFGISKVLPSSSIQVQATKKWCERCDRVKGPRVRDCHITSTSKHGKGSRWNKNRLHTAGRQTTCVWHRFLRIVSRQACASGWGGGKVVQYRSFCASPSATSQNSWKISCINLCFCRISLFKVKFVFFRL